MSRPLIPYINLCYYLSRFFKKNSFTLVWKPPTRIDRLPLIFLLSPFDVIISIYKYVITINGEIYGTFQFNRLIRCNNRIYIKLISSFLYVYNFVRFILFCFAIYIFDKNILRIKIVCILQNLHTRKIEIYTLSEIIFIIIWNCF